MSIQLIATDVDGTLMDSRHHYNQNHFRAVLDELHKRGDHFVIASGNHMGHLLKVFEGEPVDAFIAENGAQVMVNQQTIFAKPLPRTVVHQVVETLRNDPAFTPTTIRLSGYHGTYIEKTSRPVDRTTEQYYFNNIVPVDHLSSVTDSFYKVNAEWAGIDVANLATQLNAQFPNQIHAMPSGFGSMDIVSKGINKATGLQQLAAYWHLIPDQMMAFGDNGNDLEMLASVGLGVAMQNGTLATKEIANQVTLADNNHDGELKLIDELLANGTIH
ncbi:Cof-type HAD-IIB family hydrolase [Levilactobacillus bambusae]|uniref:HAD family hydrolase n=1 Tax=Levilactobacillus bambusae TaxID=2024736 RepID=A0A2V1MYV9_9LACO|nr:HAD family hydrolase [Levilactobacillus bambusae]PWG00159.1 HAD family hydrolase [Levilactobacillus bambusae]